MEKSNTTACPLCRSTANVSAIDVRRKHFSCQACGEFILWRAAENYLSGCAQQTLEEFSQEVKNTTNEDFIYVIREGDEKTMPHVDVHGECELKSRALS